MSCSSPLDVRCHQRLTHIAQISLRFPVCSVHTGVIGGSSTCACVLYSAHVCLWQGDISHMLRSAESREAPGTFVGSRFPHVAQRLHPPSIPPRSPMCITCASHVHHSLWLVCGAGMLLKVKNSWSHAAHAELLNNKAEEPSTGFVGLAIAVALAGAAGALPVSVYGFGSCEVRRTDDVGCVGCAGCRAQGAGCRMQDA